MEAKLEVESVHASHIEGHCDHLSENLKMNECTTLRYLSRHIGVNFSLRDKHR